jgi:ubiquitin carboxyl-terminal hydrolase 7
MMSTYLPLNGDLEAVDETHFTWEVDNWRQLSRKEHSPVFHCGGQPWRILFFPFGNNSDHASFYLEHGYDEKPAEDWYSCVQFLLVVWNANDPRIFVQHSATHRYTPEESDWGFTRFVELRKIHTQSWQNFGRPLVENGSARVTAYVRVVKDETGVLWHTFVHYDSKKETGMVGLKNQGTTCFLNSLIQSLYFTTAFRRAVYQMPTDINESARTLGNSPYALQRLFLQLQTSDTMVYTTELTQSFGWTNDLIYVHQQDVQELERLLMEKLEKKMKGSEIERCLPEMFMGKMKTTISCINVDYQSSRTEEFWDIALNIKGPNTMDESFQEYCQSEVLEGENKYQAEGFGYQDAKKGVLFQALPSVLHLQLMRFEFDFQRESPVKTNDYMEFPETWDASPYLSDDADRSEPYIYKLHSVLVHSGAIQAGHYYAFIRPEKNGHFYKFDDERVTRATLKEAIDENFGGETPTANGAPRSPTQRTFKRATNAYMLVYIRECHQDRILLPHEVVNPPANVANKFAEEKALLDQKRREKEEAHLYMDISVASNGNFQHHQGIDIVPTLKTDLIDPAAMPKLYREKKKLPFTGLVEHIASDLGVDADMLRVWSMVGRQNSTVRPDHPITPTNLTVEEAFAKYGNKQAFRLWVEAADERTEDGQPLFGNERIKITRPGDKAILLFLKHFDVEKQTLYGVGQFYCAWHDKISEIGPEILKLMDWPTGTNFRIHEVRSPFVSCC